jgi:E3 ubiquitin-protein ligase BAH
MKFAHNYSDALEREDYPSQWLDSAISYRQLKKCIKKVQKELSSLGLDPETLNILWQVSKEGNIDGASDLGSVGFRYRINGKFNRDPIPYIV